MKGLAEWFGAISTPNKAIMVLVAIGLLVIVGATAFHLVDTLTETAEQKGVVTERAASQGKVIQNVAKAKAAAAQYRSNPAVRDADCLLDATNPADC